jgi:hypothetical protein
LSQRLQLALTGSKDSLYNAVADPAPEVVKAALRNRLIDENHILVLLKRRDLTEELFKSLFNLETVRESHRLRVALAQHPLLPSYLLLQLLHHLYLFELVTVCHLPGLSPDQKTAAERAIIQRLPTSALGNKLTLARRATAPVLEALLLEGEPGLVELCISNPRLKESSIAQFLAGPHANAETISMIARHPRWGNRRNVRLSILRNPRTPLVWFVAFLPSFPLTDLKRLLHSQKLVDLQREAVREEMEKRGLLD